MSTVTLLGVALGTVLLPSLSAAFMIDAQTGYIGIIDFAEHTDEDLSNALEALTKKGMPAGDARRFPDGSLTIPCPRPTFAVNTVTLPAAVAASTHGYRG